MQIAAAALTLQATNASIDHTHSCVIPAPIEDVWNVIGKLDLEDISSVLIDDGTSSYKGPQPGTNRAI